MCSRVQHPVVHTPAVAKAAMDSGVAKEPVDLKEYEVRLNEMLGEIASL